MRWLTAGALTISLALISCGEPQQSQSQPQSATTTTVSITTTSTLVAVDDPPIPSTTGVLSGIDGGADLDDSGMGVVRLVPPIQEVEPPVYVNPYASFACGMYASTAIKVGWPEAQIPKVLRTMFRESRCSPWIRSTTSDSGLMQINDIVLRDWRFKRDWPEFNPGTLFNPEVNLSVALWLWTVDGWGPWRGGA